MDKLKFAKQIAYSSEGALELSYKLAQEMKDKEGVIVECGVAAGAQVIAMALGSPDKTIHAFDSFEGIPLPSNKDDQMPGIKFLTKEEQAKLPEPGKQELKSSGAVAVSLESFMNNVKGLNVVPHKGWFENTVMNFDEKICLLRLDGDLYNSTLVCLEHLYPKVVDGGVVIIDDYNLPGCKQAVKDYFKKDIELIENSGVYYFYVKHTDTEHTEKGATTKQTTKRTRKSKK